LHSAASAVIVSEQGIILSYKISAKGNCVLELDNQVGYWDEVAWDKTFSLPIDLPLLQAHLPLDSRILDYGCGYGRVCQALVAGGYSQVVGADSSAEMVQRARRMHPGLRFDVLTGPGLPYADGSFDAALLVAVLTCIPSDEGQRSLIATLERALRVGGILYIVDYVLQEDERNQRRYAQYADEFGTYGVFRLLEEAVFRHHSMGWIASLMAGFEELDVAYSEVTTMNGNPARAFQWLGRT
jgi:SAM-dependent methyltransferase